MKVAQTRRYFAGLSNIDRFRKYVDTSGGPESCHPWTGGRHPDGYGRFGANGSMYYAHRWLLGHLRGEALVRGEEACHHCDNPTCCNERHLYVSDHATNMLDVKRRNRGRGRNSGITHCQRGHEFTPENTYTAPVGKRTCKTCRRVRLRAWKQNGGEVN